MSRVTEVSKGDDASQGRRQPSRRRGMATVENILAATGDLLEEVGYDTLTTKAIAERVNMSIGSFYQYFPHKESVVSELVESYRHKIRDFLELAVRECREKGMSATWAVHLIDDLANVYRELPGFTGIWLGRHSTGPLAAQAEQLRFEIVTVLDQLLGEAFPQVAAEDRERCLVMCVETAKLLLHSEGPHQTIIQAEFNRMLGLYLVGYFGGQQPRPL